MTKAQKRSQPPPEGTEPEGGEGAPAAGAKPQSKRLQQTQAQVDEVVEIMKFNLDKVLERDQKLTQLDDRADALQEGASQFEKSAATLKSKMWWKNMKMMIIMGVVVAIIVIIIIVKYAGVDAIPGVSAAKEAAAGGGGEGAGSAEAAQGATAAPQQEPAAPAGGKSG